MQDDTQKQNKKQSRTRGLKPFTKGQSGNPGGRPKGSVSITTMLRHKLLEGDAETIVNNLIALATTVPEQRKFERTIGEGIVTIYEAYDPIEAKLHQWAVDTILERLDGKVTQPLSNADGEPLTVRVVYDRKARHATD